MAVARIQPTCIECGEVIEGIYRDDDFVGDNFLLTGIMKDINVEKLERDYLN